MLISIRERKLFMKVVAEVIS